MKNNKSFGYFISKKDLDNSFWKIYMKWLDTTYKTNWKGDTLNGIVNKQVKNMKLTVTDAKRIIDLACVNWKEQLAREWGANIVLNKEIEISEEFYKTMRNACTEKQHELFDEIFGEDFDIFSVTTYEEVCRYLKESIAYNHNNRIERTIKLDQIERFFNQGWKPDINNPNQKKWYPYFVNTSSGDLIFSGSDCYSCFRGVVAYYKNKEISDHVGKYFSNIYTNF
jgi:hypothetical protein